MFYAERFEQGRSESQDGIGALQLLYEIERRIVLARDWTEISSRWNDDAGV